MIQRIQDRLHREEKGFTLIELMVVVLIIAILIAIAIPTFLGARKRAQDRAAQSSMRNSVTSAKTIFTDGEDYTKATPTALAATEPSLSFEATSATASTGPTDMSVKAPDANTFYAAAFSKAGRCWYVRDSATGPTGGTYWGAHDQAANAGCTADAAAAWAGVWKQNPGDVVSA